MQKSLSSWNNIHRVSNDLRGLLREQYSSYDGLTTEQLIQDVNRRTANFRCLYADRNACGGQFRYMVRPALVEMRRARQALAFRLIRSN